MQIDINKYDQIKFEEKFKKTDLYNILKQDYDILSFDYHYKEKSPTPREIEGTKKSKFSVVPFYYLNFLTDVNPKKIYDLGCGWNIFKKYIPNIIGIGAESDSEHFFGDISDFVDDDYIKYHHNLNQLPLNLERLQFVVG